jgi:hypothetical protein
LLGYSAIEVLALIINSAAAAIALRVLGIGDYRCIAIVERLVESKLATICARDVQVGEFCSTPLLARDRVRAGGKPLLAIRLRIVAPIAVVGGCGVDQCCKQNWQRKQTDAAHRLGHPAVSYSGNRGASRPHNIRRIGSVQQIDLKARSRRTLIPKRLGFPLKRA